MRNALLCIWLLMLVACSGGDNDRRFQGYVEGEPLRIASAIGGRLDRLDVSRGSWPVTGAPLFALDAEAELAALQESEARLASAQARLADLEKGQRPAELDVIRAQLVQARAQRDLSAAQLQRQQQLILKQAVSDDQLDQFRTQHQRDRARVDELTAQLRSGELAGRDDALKAALDETRAAEAVIAQNQWKLDQKTLKAPAAGSVEEVYFRVGEWVAAGQPVVSLLPPQNRKLRFFVSESRLGSLKLGQTVSVACDGCAVAIKAKISFIASTAEYTPPVLYGREQRARMVFLVEAQAAPEDAEQLHPGQPVDIELAP